MATYEEKGQLTYKDDEGNLHLLNPKTKMDCVDGLEAALGDKAPASHASNKSNPHEVTAEQVGARPSDWMPTAAQVGAVPTSRTVNGKALSSNITLSASDVGARDDEWLPTPAEIGAQKLIGIGTYTGDLNDYATLMNTFAWFNGASVTNSPTTSTAVVETWGTGGSIVKQRVTSTNGYVITRMRYSNAWTEWDWVNPPMTYGNEYRTTKRISVNGTPKPVYTKRFEFKALPNATSRRVQIPNYTDAYTMHNVQFIMRHSSTDAAMQLAYGADPGFFIEEQASDKIYVVVNTTGDFSSYNGYVTIEYTK